ncbi:MAG: peptidoglycan-binding domain-containing protein [bacterium]|nr:peptidoglycan-binding domain-containing protein [bacterium]
MLKKYYSSKSVSILTAVVCACTAFPIAPVFAQTSSFYLSFDPPSGSIAQGGKTSTSINLTGSCVNELGNKLSVTLAVAQGLPSGLSVQFSPTSLTAPGNSIMNITAALTAPPGTYNIPIVGACFGQTASANFNVTVAALPTFDYSASLSSNQGSAATGESVDTTLNLYQLSGTSDNVTLSASGQPSGVTVRFSPSSSCRPACSSLVTFSVQSVTSGVYPITLSATAGSLTRKVVYSLTVAPSSLSDFSMTVFPTSNVVLKKGSVNALVNLTQLAGTSQNVTFTIGSTPASTTVQISPTSCKPPCNAVLAVSTKDNIKVGSYPVTILGYGGGITKSTEYTLIVIDPANPSGLGTGTGSGGSVVWSSLPAYTFTRSLYRGIKGDDVSRLQAYLAADPEIYPEKMATGFYGALTEKAVGRFQLKYGLLTSADVSAGYGTFGPRTRAKLNSLLAR